MNASVPEVEEKFPTEVPESAQAQEVPAAEEPWMNLPLPRSQ